MRCYWRPAFPAPSLADFNAKLRRVEQSQRAATRIPVLALDSVSARANAGDCDGYVHEPIDPVALTDAVRSLAAALGQTYGIESRPRRLTICRSWSPKNLKNK